MKKNLKKTIARVAIVGATLCLVGNAVAADQTQDQIDRLTVAKEHATNGKSSVKPSQAQRLQQSADDLQRLIDSAEGGAKLDPAQVDEAIQRSYRGY
jgi:hypothetical protein